MVLVSYIELLFTTDFVVEYFVPYIGATFPKVARQIVRDISHVLLVEETRRLRDSFFHCQINSWSAFCIPVPQYEYDSDFLSRSGDLVYVTLSYLCDVEYIE